MFTREILVAALRAAFLKLDPRVVARNPVMSWTEVGAIFITVAWATGADTDPGWYTLASPSCCG